MKRGISIFLLFILLFSFASALDDSQLDDLQGIGDQTQDTIDNLPINERGEIDKEKLGFQKTKAEERIEKIDFWLDQNTPWLRHIFGMRPEISYLFAINFLLILTFIVYFRNAFVLFSAFSETVATILALALAVMTIQLQVSVKSAEFLVGLFSQWWFKLILIAALIVVIAMSKYVSGYIKKRNLKRSTEKIHQTAKSTKPIEHITETLAND
jgi:hypothetical protein